MLGKSTRAAADAASPVEQQTSVRTCCLEHMLCNPFLVNTSCDTTWSKVPIAELHPLAVAQAQGTSVLRKRMCIGANMET